ncbi:MAG: DUF4390 domain-containing protein [Rubrivivax sp.]|nr:DUF4390 domain-containing protein [Rubrivivax sp.]
MSHRHLVRRRTLLGQGAGLLLGAGLAGVVRAQVPAPQGIELTTLRVQRADGVLSLDFVARVVLPRAVEEALTRGVPVVFVAEATLLRSRWYWRDARIARVSRQWRVAFQPLTGNWRVGLGGLNQSHATLEEALVAASRSAGWRLADLAQLDPDKSYYVEFDYRLDTSQLPSPMQFGLVTQGDWALGAARVLRVE